MPSSEIKQTNVKLKTTSDIPNDSFARGKCQNVSVTIGIEKKTKRNCIYGMQTRPVEWLGWSVNTALIAGLNGSRENFNV